MLFFYDDLLEFSNLFNVDFNRIRFRRFLSTEWRFSQSIEEFSELTVDEHHPMQRAGMPSQQPVLRHHFPCRQVHDALTQSASASTPCILADEIDVPGKNSVTK